jgi:hypothetical protein
LKKEKNFLFFQKKKKFEKNFSLFFLSLENFAISKKMKRMKKTIFLEQRNF